MKKLILFSIAASLLFSCKENLAPTSTLFEKDFAASHKEWKIMQDTFKKDTLMGYKNLEVPIRISWVAALDTSKCHRIAYFKLERLPSDAGITIQNVRTSSIPCSTKWESEDERRFEMLLFFGMYKAKKGIKEYRFEGQIGKVSGIGESDMIRFKN
ncbi:hypothetical protein [Pedobacter psychrodurus]|uniref:hypothetical protein n=1 Tax=Pedobacter psychrodurus TaxID=2530456 RepID=UPI00292FF0BA|nr:hypothetical protein [Pedobacter psychrodurus]